MNGRQEPGWSEGVTRGKKEGVGREWGKFISEQQIWKDIRASQMFEDKSPSVWEWEWERGKSSAGQDRGLEMCWVFLLLSPFTRIYCNCAVNELCSPLLNFPVFPPCWAAACLMFYHCTLDMKSATHCIPIFTKSRQSPTIELLTLCLFWCTQW